MKNHIPSSQTDCFLDKPKRSWIDIEAQRRQLRALEGKITRKAELWRFVQRLARQNPDSNPWLLPFVALIDERSADISQAKAAIDAYLAEAEEKGSCGYLFNIWCFAFPHCRWAMWFDLMCDAGFYSQEEADTLAAKFLLIQFRDHHTGMLNKPFPECVDNQHAALVLSSFVVGSIFAEGPGNGNLARKLRDEAAPRLEAMIGGMPNSGYSGEGSTYQGLIVAFAVPFLTEMLEDLRGEDIFDKALWPQGTSPRSILEMTRRLWMPGGLLLPWDHYGYQFGITFPLAYLAHRTGDLQSLRLLEHTANIARMTTVDSGWGFDQPVWTLVYWPDEDVVQDGVVWTPWAEDELGAVLVDPDGENYLMQMWDFTEAMCHRTHVNPNSLILARKGIPFSADGRSASDCDALKYEGALFERNFGAGVNQTLNLSSGCGGSHNAILVDGYEGLRPPQGESQGRLIDFRAEEQCVTGDVTHLYTLIDEDCLCVRRRSWLIENRFWVVEDLAAFSKPHEFTSRWWFRPDVKIVDNGVDVQTPEGALLQMRCVQGVGEASLTRIEGFPTQPDGCSDRVDFQMSGTEARWLYVLWPTDTVEIVRELIDGWEATAAVDPTISYKIHPGSPPWFQQDVDISSAWKFVAEIDVKEVQLPLLQLSRGIDPRSTLQLNDIDIDLSDLSNEKLMPYLIDCEPYLECTGSLRISLSLNFTIGEVDKMNSFSFPDQPFALCRRIIAPDLLAHCSYDGETLNVESSSGVHYTLGHKLLSTETETLNPTF